MTPREEARVAEWHRRSDAPATLTLLDTGGPRMDGFREFAADLVRLAPRVTLKTEREDAPGALPGYRVGDGVAFHMVPLGRELSPFLMALSPEGPSPPDGAAEALADLRAPVTLRLYVALTCPHCPMALQGLLGIAAASEKVRLSVIDGGLFPDRAEADKIQAVPTLFLENRRWTGQVQPAEILDALAGVDPADMSPATMERMIAEGQAPKLAELMEAEGRFFPAVLDVLTHETWPVRLGAMVAAETLADEAPEIAAEMAAPLWGRYAEADDTVRGDILYVLGLVGGPDDLPAIRKIAGGDAAEGVREAAAEAADLIRERL
ncbi:MAG: hypothetical protein ACLFTV_08760 [Desulfococcaceae bacterium]